MTRTIRELAAVARSIVLAIVLAIVLGAGGIAAAQSPPPAGPDVPAIQKLLGERKLDGWLLYDFRGVNAIAQEIVRPVGHQSRRWFYLVPARGEPVAIVPRIEAPNFDAVPGRKVPFSSWKELEAALRAALKGHRRIAMEYSPRGQIATISRVDAGTIELVRSMGAQVVSSGDLVQAVKSRWSADGRESHAQAARALERIRDEAFAFIARRLREGRPLTEWDVASRIKKALDQRGFDGGPIVAIGPNAANPHYGTAEKTASPIAKGDLVLIDVTAKGRGPGAICADQTWMAFAGEAVPERAARLFAVVRQARDAALAFVKAAHAQKKTIRGFQVDEVARGVVIKAGFGANFIHRTGHSIDTRCHGDGVNMDSFETRDEQALIPGVGFSIEPGIYIPGEIGVRSEIDVYYGQDGVEVTSQGVQDEIPALLANANGRVEPPDEEKEKFRRLLDATDDVNVPTAKTIQLRDRPGPTPTVIKPTGKAKGDFGEPARDEYLDEMDAVEGGRDNEIEKQNPDGDRKPKK